MACFLKTIGSRFVIIAHEKMVPQHVNLLHRSLLSEGLDVNLLTFPSGESHKTRRTKELLEDSMFELNLGRDTCLIAIGGGVVTDISAFLAATYCRGIPLVMIPTTLLAMVDASIGGKAGVNVPYGKNMVGVTYRPKKIWIDPLVLQTLPLKELRCGVAEMIKHGLIADHHLFEYLEEHAELILSCDLTILEKAIFESCRIKKEIVEQDEKEIGVRRLLNFGHTVGHALESVCDYSLSHGEAVAIGLIVESYLAMQLGILSKHSFEKIRRIFVKYGFPLQLTNNQISLQNLLDKMILDKKSLKGKPRFVMIDEIGSSMSFDGGFCTEVEENLLRRSLQWMLDDLCSH